MIKEVIIYSISNYQDLKCWAWSGAVDTLEIIEDNKKEDELIALLNDTIESNGGSIEETKLNDFLWFDSDYILDALDISLDD